MSFQAATGIAPDGVPHRPDHPADLRPVMTDGVGAQLIGPWFGTGPDRGIALVFVLTRVIGLCVTGAALRSRLVSATNRPLCRTADALAPC